MGFELPAAIGAQLAKPDRQVISISGDGSFLQSMQELQTAILAGTPVCAVVLDNSGWISIKGGQETFFGRSAWTDFRTPDGSLYSPAFDDIARAFGLHAERVTDPEMLRPALERAFANAPALVDVLITQDAQSSDAGKGLGAVQDYQALTAWDDAERRRRNEPVA